MGLPTPFGAQCQLPHHCHPPQGEFGNRWFCMMVFSYWEWCCYVCMMSLVASDCLHISWTTIHTTALVEKVTWDSNLWGFWMVQNSSIHKYLVYSFWYHWVFLERAIWERLHPLSLLCWGRSGFFPSTCELLRFIMVFLCNQDNKRVRDQSGRPLRWKKISVGVLGTLC